MWKLAAACALLLGAYVAFPYWAVGQLDEALRSGEQAQLERAIDFDSLRTSLRKELDARGRAMIGEGAVLNGLADLFGGALLDNAVEVYVSPQALATLIRTGELSKAAVAGVVRPDAAKDFEIDLGAASWAFFTDPTTFAVELPNAALTLQLQGWRWQLVEVRPKRSDVTAEPAQPEKPAASLGSAPEAAAAPTVIERTETISPQHARIELP